MTSTIATMATNIKNRLNVGTGGAVGTSAEPTDSVVQGWVRDAFKQLMGDLTPIAQTTASIAAGAATLANDRVFYVEVNQTPLLRGSEYGQTPTGLSFRDPALDGETATIFYIDYPDVSGATVDTSCIFGPDWLEELATIKAAQEVCSRLANNSASQSPTDYAALYRTLGEQFNRLYTWHRKQLDDQLNLFNVWQQQRLQFGKRPLPESAYAGMTNLSKVSNDLLGRP